MAQAPTQPNPREMWVDHETGLIHWPAKDNKPPEPLNGPTTVNGNLTINSKL